MVRFLWIVISLFTVITAVSGAPEDHPALQVAMQAAALRPSDLFVDPALRRRDVFRLNRVEAFMRRPLHTPDYLQQVAGDIANSDTLSEATRFAAAAIEVHDAHVQMPPVPRSLREALKQARKSAPLFSPNSMQRTRKRAWKPTPLARNLPPEVDAAVARLLCATEHANELLRPAFSGLSLEQTRKLRAHGRDLVHWVRGQENVQDFDPELLTALRAVDLGRLISVGVAWLKNVDEVVTALVAWRATEAGKEYHSEGLLLDQATSLGRVVIGGTGTDRYEGGVSPCVLVDIGGDDVYQIPVGAGWEKVAVAIDLNGNDLYQSREEVNAGAGVIGLGALVDVAGNDRYETGDTSAGVCCAGVGVCADLGGDDDYHCGETSLGAACYGVGLMLEEAGHDNYLGSHYSQGVSFTLGFGALVDRAGRDTYLCGRRIYGWSTSEKFFSAGGQGFSWGIREYTSGGIGLLVDVSGDDSYYGNNLAQGMGYWYGLGALVDGSGDDRYYCTHYGQGGGVHFGIGVLLDNAGDDTYHGSVTTGGNGYDRSIGVLVDYSGNDFHRHEHIAGGAGMFAGCGLFCDNEGDDTYHGGTPAAMSYGSGQIDRDRVLGAIGVFLDLKGRDNYVNRPMGDGGFWQQGDFGVALDTEAPPLFAVRFVMKERPARPGATQSTYAVKTAAAKTKIEEYFRIIADYGADRKAKEEATTALLALPLEESLPFLMRQLVHRPFYPSFGAAYELLPKLGAKAIPALAHLLESNDAEERDRAVDVLRDIEDPLALPLLRAALHDASHQVRLKAVYALGKRKDVDSAIPVARYLRDPEPWMRGAAAQALSAMATVITAPPRELLAALKQALNDNFWAARHYAARSLGLLGDAGWPMVNELLSSANLDARVLGLMATGLMVSSPCTSAERKTVCRALLLEHAVSADPRLRTAAARALGLTSDKSLIESIKALEGKEPNSEIRFAFQGATRLLTAQ